MINLSTLKSKDTVKRVKREVGVGKDFATHTTHKGSSPERVKILQMGTQQTDDPMEKLDKRIECVEIQVTKNI